MLFSGQLHIVSRQSASWRTLRPSDTCLVDLTCLQKIAAGVFDVIKKHLDNVVVRIIRVSLLFLSETFFKAFQVSRGTANLRRSHLISQITLAIHVQYDVIRNILSLEQISL
jgi:hypothetical protein